MNRMEHMTLSEKIGKLKGTTTITVEKEGIYNEHVEQQHYDLSLLSNDQYGIRKGASL